MPKCVVILQYVKDRDRLKSHSFFLPPDFTDSWTVMNSESGGLWIYNQFEFEIFLKW